MENEEIKKTENKNTVEIKELSAFEQLQIEYKFKIVDELKDSAVQYIEFENGRRYKFQHPPFLTAHKIIMEAESDHEVFVFALSCIFPAGKNSPEINELYLNTNRADGFYLWSPLARGLLSGS